MLSDVAKNTSLALAIGSKECLCGLLMRLCGSGYRFVSTKIGYGLKEIPFIARPLDSGRHDAWHRLDVMGAGFFDRLHDGRDPLSKAPGRARSTSKIAGRNKAGHGRG